jgi:hypothetical protein
MGRGDLSERSPLARRRIASCLWRLTMWLVRCSLCAWMEDEPQGAFALRLNGAVGGHNGCMPD